MLGTKYLPLGALYYRLYNFSGSVTTARNCSRISEVKKKSNSHHRLPFKFIYSNGVKSILNR